jgi:ABC-type Co2+ transport system permease subunit
MNSEMKYHLRRHPIGSFLAALTLGPFVLAAILLVTVIYVLASIFLALFGREDVDQEVDVSTGVDEARW